LVIHHGRISRNDEVVEEWPPVRSRPS
jgi:hypothetical protein